MKTLVNDKTGGDMSQDAGNQSVAEHNNQNNQESAINRILNLLKIIWLSFWLLFATILVAGPILTLSLLRFNSNTVFSFVRLWARIILRVSGVSLIASGTEKVIKGHSYIVISNHQSHFDGPALAAGLGLQLRWIAKKELQRIPVFGHALKAAGTIFIDRGDRDTAMNSIKEGMEHLPQNVGIMVFAEGTRSVEGTIGEFKKGGFIAALQTGFPILPVTIKGSSRALPKGGVIFHPGEIEVVVGDVIDPTAFGFDQMDVLIEKTRETIVANYQSPGTPPSHPPV